MVDTETGEFTEKTLAHEGNKGARVLRSSRKSSGGGNRSHRGDAVVFRVAGGVRGRVPGRSFGKDPAAETGKQKHDRRDARLELKLLVEDRFPRIWMPSSEQRDLRTLLRDRH
jgi:transposase